MVADGTFLERRVSRRCPLSEQPQNMRLTALCVATLCAATAAQSTSVVIPDGLASTEGSTFDWATARYLPARSQMIYDASVLTGLGTTAITNVGVRANYTSTSTYPAHDVVTSLKIGYSATQRAATASTSSFNANDPGNYTTVLNNVTVSYPAVSGTTPNPRGYVSIPLTNPAPYVSGNTLVMLWDVASTSGNTEVWLWYNDAQFYSTGGSGGTYASTGTTCPPGSTSQGFAARGGSDLSWYFYSGSGNNVPTAGFIGTSKTTWGGIPLPFDLTPLGGAGCSIYTDGAAVLPGQTDATGTLGRIRYDVPIPADPSTNGVQLYTQSFVVDPTYNSLGIRASALNEYVLGTSGSAVPAKVLIDYARTISDSPRVNYNDGIVFSIN